MTCKEKLAIEHPDKINENRMGGAVGCPSTYGYLDDPHPDFCKGDYCNDCWNREIPETHEWLKESPHISDSAKDAMKRLGESAKRAAESIAAGCVAATSSIKDSGDRTQFATGAVRDMREGKGRCDLMPLEVVAGCMPDPSAKSILQQISYFQKTNNTGYLMNCINQFARHTQHKCNYLGDVCSLFLEVAKHFEEGAKKYGENNWQKGIPVKCYIDSAVRHYLKWLRGDEDEPHDRAFVWNLMCCIWEVDYHGKEDGHEEN